tara:strand:- start:222 stop:674 length:453 start_codon:yes stop_codon:yes gene_type:complete
MNKIISHRGNISGPEPWYENKPSFIEEARSKGFDVEIDVWFVEGEWFLGHDEPEYITSESFLNREGLWCHAKNIESFNRLLNIGAACFWHEDDKYTLTSNGFIWTYPGMILTKKSICVMPEKYSACSQDLTSCFGICTDYPEKYKKGLAL